MWIPGSPRRFATIGQAQLENMLGPPVTELKAAMVRAHCASGRRRLHVSAGVGVVHAVLHLGSDSEAGCRSRKHVTYGDRAHPEVECRRYLLRYVADRVHMCCRLIPVQRELKL
jgi:hypothetical protein